MQVIVRAEPFKARVDYCDSVGPQIEVKHFGIQEAVNSRSHNREAAS